MSEGVRRWWHVVRFCLWCDVASRIPLVGGALARWHLNRLARREMM